MKMHCLGTAGYHPNETRHTSCYFIPERGLMLDAGSGLFRLTSLVETEELDILLSHAHLDHIVGLTYLLDVQHELRQSGGKSLRRVRIFGQQEKLDAVREHLFSDLVFPAPLDAQWISIDVHPVFEAGGAQVSWRTQPHPGTSVAYRLDWGQTRLVYATDTSGSLGSDAIGWARERDARAAGPDLLIHECYFRDSQADWAVKTGHSWTGRVAQIAAAIDPDRLLLTHINPLEPGDDPVDRAQIADSFSGELLVARDGLVVEF